MSPDCIRVTVTVWVTLGLKLTAAAASYGGPGRGH